MHVIARHSVVNFLAFGLTRLMGLVLVGFIVDEYGLAIFGLLMLVRSFMPGTLFSVLDCGLPDFVTRSAPRDLESGKNAEALGTATASALVLGCIGLLLAVPLVVAPDFSARLFFGLDPEHRALLAPAIVAHGLVLPLLFVGVIAEGALRGQEAFKALRLVDVCATLLYSAVALALIYVHASPVDLALAFLGSHVLRATATIAIAARGYRAPSSRAFRPNFRLLYEERAYLRAVVGRRIGGRFASQLPRLVISHVLGPAATGLFEAILRLPVFLRSLITLVNSAVMPVVVRMNASGGKAELSELAVQGPRLLLAFASLTSLPTICLARPLLHLWLGTEVEPYWPWFAALCALPLFSASVGFWNAMGRAELDFLRKASVIAVIQTAIVVAVAAPLLTTLQVPAIWLGMFCSLLYAAPAYLLLNARKWSLSPWRLAFPVAAVLAASIPAAAFGAALVHWVDLDSWPRLISAFAAISVVQVLMLAIFIVRPAERRSLLRFRRAERRVSR